MIRIRSFVCISCFDLIISLAISLVISDRVWAGFRSLSRNDYTIKMMTSLPLNYQEFGNLLIFEGLNREPILGLFELPGEIVVMDLGGGVNTPNFWGRRRVVGKCEIDET